MSDDGCGEVHDEDDDDDDHDDNHDDDQGHDGGGDGDGDGDDAEVDVQDEEEDAGVRRKTDPKTGRHTLYEPALTDLSEEPFREEIYRNNAGPPGEHLD